MTGYTSLFDVCQINFTWISSNFRLDYMHFRDAYILHIVSEISQIALHTCILQCRFAIWMYEVYVLVHLHFKSKSLWLLTLIYWNLIRRITQKIILSFCVEVHQLCSDLSNSNSILMYPHNVSFRMKVLYLPCTR